MRGFLSSLGRRAWRGEGGTFFLRFARENAKKKATKRQKNGVKKDAKKVQKR